MTIATTDFAQRRAENPSATMSSDQDEASKENRMAAMIAALSPKIHAIHVETRAEGELRAFVEARVTEESKQIPPHGLLHLISGRSNTGKSQLLTAVEAWPSLQSRSGLVAVVCPAIIVIVPFGADGDDLVTEILQALSNRVRFSFFVGRDKDDNLRRLKLLLTRHKVRWIFFDQAERLTSNRAKRKNGLGAFDLICLLARDLARNIVTVGTPDALCRIDADDRLKPLASRQVVEALPLDPIDQLKDFVVRFVARLPLSLRNSSLTDSDTLTDLYIASGDGVQGALADLLQRAAVNAVRLGHKEISAHQHLAQADSERTGKPIDASPFRLKSTSEYKPLASHKLGAPHAPSAVAK